MASSTAATEHVDVAQSGTQTTDQSTTDNQNSKRDTISTTEQLQPSFTQIASVESTTKVASTPNQADQQTIDPIVHSKVLPSDTTNNDAQDQTVPLSSFNSASSPGTISEKQTEFVLPITEEPFSTTNPSMFSNLTLDLTKYYEELKQIAIETEHDNDQLNFSTLPDIEDSSYEWLFCPSQPFLARLSLQGQMFETE